MPGRAADLVVAELGDHGRARRRAVTAVRRHRRRRRDRELSVRGQGLALDRPHAPQVVAKRQRRARPDPDRHVLPVLAGRVVDDGPALDHHLALIVHRDPVRRLPHRGLGHVGEDDVGDLAGLLRRRDVERHLQERAAIGLLAREADRQRPAGARLDDGQRLEEVVDAVARHADGQLAAGDLGAPLVVRDAVAVHDDATERDLVDLDEGLVLGVAARDEGGGEQSRG